MTERLPPPGLPEPLVDERADIPERRLESTWDTLARTAIELECIHRYGNRVRVIWVRRAVLRWCCRRPMRIGRFEYQPQHVTFGWTRDVWRFVACGRCGRIARLW